LFIEVIETSFKFLTFPIWETLSHRLALSLSPKMSSDPVVKVLNLIIWSFDVRSAVHWNIPYLANKFGDYVEDRGFLSVSASGNRNPQSCPLRFVADFENQTYFDPNNEPNSRICKSSQYISINGGSVTITFMKQRYIIMFGMLKRVMVVLF
jgi:hypothetical protein